METRKGGYMEAGGQRKKELYQFHLIYVFIGWIHLPAWIMEAYLAVKKVLHDYRSK
jgi:hypothetical protein